MRLPLDYFCQEDVVGLARDLIGRELHTSIGGVHTAGVITESEAYRGPEDRASHAYGGRRTQRTEVMFGPGGRSYVYLCYGIHHLFNIVTYCEGVPHAVLIRRLEPTCGTEGMAERRGLEATSPRLCSGPGSLAKAMGITLDHTGLPLDGSLIWVEEGERAEKVVASPRIGIDYAGDDALLPWRFTGPSRSR